MPFNLKNLRISNHIKNEPLGRVLRSRLHHWLFERPVTARVRPSGTDTGGRHVARASDLVLRNVNTGAFEVYNIANNQLMAPRPWDKSAWIGSSAGLAVDRPSGVVAGSSDQLVREMAASRAMD